MMSNTNNIASKEPPTKDENQTDGGGGRKPSSQRPPEQTLRCPRCDSTNTKFCYYNNYNLTQPRYFCKTCRRYWTKGGALRNIPIGGGCRKNKKTKSCTSKFIIGDSSPVTAVDFQLGGINYPHRVVNQLSSASYGQNSQTNLPFMNLDPLGFSYPKGDFQEMGFTNNNFHHNTSLTSSIESLSSLNQDLHWKLQQQRLAVLFGGGASVAAVSAAAGENNNNNHQQQKESGLQPILFQNLETPRKEVSGGGGGSDSGGGVGGLATEWFFDNHYAPVNMNSASTGNDQNGNNIDNWNGIQGWNHMNHYNALP